MGCPPPREGSGVAFVVFMALLFLLAAQDSEKLAATYLVSSLLLYTLVYACMCLDDGSVADGKSRGRAAAVAHVVVAPDLCSEQVVEVSQCNVGSLLNGVPSYNVTITNTCLDCTVCDVHVSCGEFASTELVDPSDFRRLSYGDCLVRNGGPMGPGDTISFEYSNSFIYQMEVATVSCGDI